MKFKLIEAIEPTFNKNNEPMKDENIEKEPEEETDKYTIKHSPQAYNSADTSINSAKVPAIFGLVTFKPNTINLDYGGGRYDTASEYLKSEYNATNLIYDPFNRKPPHNYAVKAQIKANKGADTATCSNVLNVIKEPEIRTQVLQNIYTLLKPSGVAYFTVYEGNGSRVEKATSRGYQLNRPTADYVDEIKAVFPKTTRRGKLIISPK